MRTAIARLKQRLLELQAFDPATIKDLQPDQAINEESGLPDTLRACLKRKLRKMW